MAGALPGDKIAGKLVKAIRKVDDVAEVAVKQSTKRTADLAQKAVRHGDHAIEAVGDVSRQSSKRAQEVAKEARERAAKKKEESLVNTDGNGNNASSGGGSYSKPEKVEIEGVDGDSLKGEYKDVKGHHIHAKAAFKDNNSYDPKKGFSIGQEYMRMNGWDHQSMTNMQRELFNKLSKSGKQNTLKEHSRIAVEALVAGGATRSEARNLVAESVWNLRKQGVTFPSGIPWNQ